MGNQWWGIYMGNPHDQWSNDEFKRTPVVAEGLSFLWTVFRYLKPLEVCNIFNYYYMNKVDEWVSSEITNIIFLKIYKKLTNNLNIIPTQRVSCKFYSSPNGEGGIR